MEMDCLRTQATVSALHDGEHVTEENAEAARVHVAKCGPCREFEADLGQLGVLPSPQAPADMIDRVMAAVSAIAADRVADDQAVPPEAEQEPLDDEPATPRFAWFTGRARWGAYAAMASAAAVIVLVAFISTRGPSTPASVERQTAATGSGAADLTYSAPKATDGIAGSAAAPTPAPARAPDYVAFKGRVYAPGALLADSTPATQSIGAVSTAFGGAGAPTDAAAYRSPITDGSVVIAGPDGRRIYSPVVRMFSSVKYQMVAGNALDRFGTWPELPTRFATPTSPDGSPTFVSAGGDALGVQTFTASGVAQTQGFAVAPGTPSSDPAGSNPNWTWWEPLLLP